MDKNTVIGLLLIFALFMGFSFYQTSQMKKQKAAQEAQLSEEIEKESAKHQVVTHILVQVNVSKEESKSGIETEQAIDLIRAISEMKHVQVDGLMTIAPEDENPENVRCYFRMLKKLSLDIDALNIDNIFMNFLSMGMSGDFVVAINEGSNLVRIGTKIFGARDYSNM